MIQRVMVSLSLLLIVGFLVSCDTSNQKENGTKNEKVTIKRVEVKPIHLAATESFDIMSSKLPEHFEAHNEVLVSLAKNLYSFKVSEKGEFETTKDYKLRVKGSGPIQEFLGTDTPGKHYLTFTSAIYGRAFYRDLGMEYDAHNVGMEYNADNKKLKIDTGSTTDTSGHELGVNEVEESSYMAHNGFGAEQLVDKFSGPSVKLYFDSDPKGLLVVKKKMDTEIIENQSKKISRSYYSFFKEIPMDVDQAKQVLGKYNSLLFIFTLQKPWATYYHHKLDASYDSPFEIDEDVYILHAKIEQVWLYENFSGDVFKKWGEEEAK